MTTSEAIEAVNGKIDLGIRKIRAAYVENATTIYGYTDSEFHILKEYTDKIDEAYKSASILGDLKITENEIFLIYSDKDKCAARARIEQAKAGPGGNKVRARLIDIGRGDLFDAAKLRQIPAEIKSLPTICQRYKMADLKPKGRDEGFSAQDREKGAEWLRAMISKYGPVVKANCHQIVNYKGGIMFEGEIGGKNINQLALMQGLAVPNPNLLPKQPGPFMMGPPGGFRPGPPMPPMRPMPHHQEWDADYLEYGGGGRANMPIGGPGPAPRMPLRRPKTNGSGMIPNQVGFNAPKVDVKAAKNQGADVQKLKSTVQTLESSLSRKNKEIAELKKSKNDEGENGLQNLGEAIARVQALRLSHNPQDDQAVREKVSDTTRLVRDIYSSLTSLGKKSSDADKAVTMLTQCQEQILTLDDAKPLEVTLEGAKQAVAKYAGSYIMEFNELRSHLDDGCEVLQQVLIHDVPGPQVKLNVGQLEASKRKEIVEVAAQMADQWAKEDKKETARCKSDEALANLINGLTESAVHLKGAASGQGLPQRPLPNISQLTRKAYNCHNFELGLLSPPGSAAAESISGVNSGMNYASVMATLAKGITICLAEKAVAEDKFQKYSEVTANGNY